CLNTWSCVCRYDQEIWSCVCRYDQEICRGTEGNMIRNHNLAQAIMDATWGQLQRFSAYKVERRGGRVILVNPNGTSQKCSQCGMVTKEKLDLSVRMFECWSCGLVLDRDHNAALNILKLGL